MLFTCFEFREVPEVPRVESTSAWDESTSAWDESTSAWDESTSAWAESMSAAVHVTDRRKKSTKPSRVAQQLGSNTIQTKGRPPTLLLFCNVDALPVSFMRYWTRTFQESFSMFGMEIRLAVKKNN